jgi:competence protein ComEC
MRAYLDITSFRYTRFHTSILLAYVSFGLLIGLTVGRSIAIESETPFLIAGLILLLSSLKSGRWWALIIAALAGMIFGFIRGATVNTSYLAYASLHQQSTSLSGVMNSDAQQTTGGQQRFTLSQIKIYDGKYVGDIYVTTFGKEKLKRGDHIVVSGTLREGFASYGAAMNSAKIERVARNPDMIRDIRERFGIAIRDHISEPMASLGLGFVVGQRSTLPDSLDEQLKIVGLTHIVVASGYNLTILVRFMMRVLSRHSRYLALVGSLSAILLFVLFSGFSPSMNRAVIITVLGLLAWYVGRRFHPVFLILYVAATTSFYNPMYIWADLGWYLSFFAFAGILILAPLLIRMLYQGKEPNSFIQLVIETLSAEIMALPLIAFAFSTFPVFGLIANVLVGPFIPAAMALTALTGSLAMINAQLGAVIALPTTILIAYMIAVVEWLADIPWAQYDTELGITLLLSWYIMLALLMSYIVRKYSYDFRARDRKLEI